MPTIATIRCLPALLPIILSSAVLCADVDEQATTAPLFADDALLEVTIEAPFGALMRERPDVEYLDGAFSYPAPDGSTRTLEIKLRTRGNYRRDEEHCDFAPIRLNFRKGQVTDTLLAGQDKLKLVTHCRSDRSMFEKYLLREYLAYRFYHALTPVSYDVRLLRVTYADTESGDSIMRLGFVIEDDEAVAERNDVQTTEVEQIAREEIDRRLQNLVHVFAYMIGNTEYSLLNPEPDKPCCHNADIFSATGNPPYLPVPFDFDFAGLVDAEYALPNPRYPIDSVRERYYKGLCTNNDLLPATLQGFADARDEFNRIIDRYSDLSDYSARIVRAYLDSFFKRIRDPGSVQKWLADRCHEPDG
jgi:hypothetical protein